MSPEARDDIGELLSAYLDEEVTAEERARVEALLKSDAQARALLASLRQTAQAVRELPRSDAPPEVMASIATRLERESLLADADSDVTLARHRRPPLRATLGVAAMLAFAIGGGLYVSLQLAKSPYTDAPIADGNRLRDRQFEPSARSMEKETSSGTRGNAPSARLKSEFAVETSPLPAEERSAGRDDLAPTTLGKTVEGDALFAESTRDLFKDLGVAPDGDSSAVAAAGTITTLDSATSVDKLEARTDSAQLGQAEALAGGSLAFDLEAQAQLTFEQRLIAGDDWPELLNHEFAREPLRLTARFSTPAGAERLSNRVAQILAEREVPSAKDVAEASVAEDALTAGRPTLVRRAADAAAPQHRRLLYLAGTPGRNFAADSTDARQILARVPAEWLADLVDEIAASDAQQVVLQLGGVIAAGPEQARDLASRLIAPAAGAPKPGAHNEPAEFANWLALFKQFASRAVEAKGLPEPRSSELAVRESDLLYETQTEAGSNGLTAGADADELSSTGTLTETAQSEIPSGTSGLKSISPNAVSRASAPMASAPSPESGPRELITVVIELDVDAGVSALDIDSAGQ